MSLTYPLLKETRKVIIMKVEQAKQLIQKYQEYVDAYENYHPSNMKQTAIKLYAELNNVSEVAHKLNDLGYRKDGKLVAGKRGQVKLISNDVTELLNSEVDPNDQLHPIVKKILNRNRRRKGVVV